MNNHKDKISPTPEHPLHESNAFLFTCRRLANSNRAEYGLYLTRMYRHLFNEDLPIDKPVYMIRIKIAYKLMYQGLTQLKQPISSKLQQNYTSSQTFSLNEMHPETAHLIKLGVQAEGGENHMKSKLRKAKSTLKKARKHSHASNNGKPKVGVAMSWVAIMAANFKKKLKDPKLAMAMRQAHPGQKKYTEADVRKHRSLYNNGRIAGMSGKPKVALQAY